MLKCTRRSMRVRDFAAQGYVLVSLHSAGLLLLSDRLREELVLASLAEDLSSIEIRRSSHNCGHADGQSLRCDFRQARSQFECGLLYSRVCFCGKMRITHLWWM